MHFQSITTFRESKSALRKPYTVSRKWLLSTNTHRGKIFTKILHKAFIQVAYYSVLLFFPASLTNISQSIYSGDLLLRASVRHLLQSTIPIKKDLPHQPSTTYIFGKWTHQHNMRPYQTRFVHYRPDGGTSIAIADTRTRRVYDFTDQAFIRCAVNQLHLNPAGPSLAYWVYKGGIETNHDVDFRTLTAIADYIHRVSSNLNHPDIGRDSSHWSDVFIIAEGDQTSRFVVECLRNRPQPEATPLFTRFSRSNGETLVVDRRSGEQYNSHQQAFSVCAVTILQLKPREVDAAYWRWKGGPRGPYIASTLLAIAVYVQSQLSDDVRLLKHWRLVRSMAEGSYMQEVVLSHLPGHV